MHGHGSHPPGLSRRARLLAIFALLAGVFLMHGPSPDRDLGATAGHSGAMAMSGWAPMSAAAVLGSTAPGGGELRSAHPSGPAQRPAGHSAHTDGACLAFLLSAATTLVVLTGLSVRRRQGGGATSESQGDPGRRARSAFDLGAARPPSLASLCLSRT